MWCKLKSIDPMLLYETSFHENIVQVYLKKIQGWAPTWSIQIYNKNNKIYHHDKFSPPSLVCAGSNPIFIFPAPNVFFCTVRRDVYNQDVWEPYDCTYIGHTSTGIYCKNKDRPIFITEHGTKSPKSNDLSNITNKLVPIGASEYKYFIRYENYIVANNSLYLVWDLSRVLPLSGTAKQILYVLMSIKRKKMYKKVCWPLWKNVIIPYSLFDTFIDSQTL